MAVEQVSEETINFARETMVGDIRDLSLQWIKQSIAWQAFNEEIQQRIIDSVTKGAEAAVEKMAEIMASDGRETIVAQLESLTVKEGIKLSLKCGFSEETLVVLGRAQGSTVHLVRKEAASYGGTRGPVHPDPDQPELPLNTAGTNNGERPDGAGEPG